MQYPASCVSTTRLIGSQTLAPLDSSFRRNDDVFIEGFGANSIDWLMPMRLINLEQAFCADTVS